MEPLVSFTNSVIWPKQCYYVRTMYFQQMIYLVLTLFSIKHVFDYLKVYHLISVKPEVEQVLMLLLLDIPSYDLPGLNVNIPDNHSAVPS